jgi:hypothetical protein
LAARFIASRHRAADRAAGDGLFVALSIAHAAALVFVPSVPLAAVGLWWNANTIAHNFIHRPFFHSRRHNRVFAVWLSVVLGVPQSLWRARHLQHHRETAATFPRMALPSSLLGSVFLETAVIAVVWGVCVLLAPDTFLTAYLPGYVVGLALCQVQGHFEHAGGTTSHYGRVYNWLFFNDGYHVEHHRRPGAHWTELRSSREHGARQSRWPPVLRWLDAVTLDALEHLVLRSRLLQRFVIGRHEQACRRLLSRAPGIRSVLIVGGGLFPRSAIVLRRLLPDADITIVDANETHLALARVYVDARVRLECATFGPDTEVSADLLVVPLAYRGDRRAIYADPPAPIVFVHDWIWSRAFPGTSISWLLCKRLNCVSRTAA